MPTTLERTERITRLPARRSDKQAATKLRRLRLNKGLSPEQLGAFVGVSGQTIRNIEAGRVVPNPRTMFALAEFFELEVTDLWRS